MNDFKLIVNAINNNIDFDMQSVKKLIEIYLESDENKKKEIREEVYTLKCNLKILSISEQLSELAYTLKSIQFIEEALILHSIEDFRWDPRENLIYLSIIWFVSKELSLNSFELFEACALKSSTQTAEYILEFANRPQAMKSLSAMGLEANKKDGEIVFEQKKAPWQK